MSINYDAIAADYAKHRTTHPAALKTLVEESRISRASTVLEVGCGTGNYIVALEKSTGCTGFGIEPSAKMLDHAQARSTTIDFRQGTLEQGQYDDGFFDLVFSVDVIHYIDDLAAFFAEAQRILKPGGQVFLAPLEVLSFLTARSLRSLKTQRSLRSYFTDSVRKLRISKDSSPAGSHQ